MSLNISLPAEVERYVRRKVDVEGYASVSEVFRDAIRLMRAQDLARLEALRADIARGVESLDRGEGVDLDDAELQRVVKKGRRLRRR
jgi:antitoxin ParD1/3/4